MQLLDAIRSRRTTNGSLDDRPVSIEDQHLLIEMASLAPSHFNCQPWRFVLVDDPARIGRIADISAGAAREVIDGGSFFHRYRRYFRFSTEEMERSGTGVLVDQMPALLRPFTRLAMSDRATEMMRRLGVASTIGADHHRLVAGSPLIVAALLDRSEYIPTELSGFYSVFGLGAAIQNLWLTTVELGLGMQFVSLPTEVDTAWAEVEALLRVPDDLALMALYRIGHLPDDGQRPTIDWSSPKSDHRLEQPEPPTAECDGLPQRLHRSRAAGSGG